MSRNRKHLTTVRDFCTGLKIQMEIKMETSSLMQNRAKMIFPFIAIVISAQSAIAEIVSSHNEQHVAEQAARDRLRAGGCAWTKTTRAQSFRVVVDQLGVRVLGNELLVTCSERAPTVLRVTWTAPTTREDGSALLLSEIRGYQVSVNDQLIAMTAATEYQVEKGDAPIKLSIRTVDTTGLISDPAEVTSL